MTILALLIPLSLLMGAVGLGAFLWSLGSGQYDDLDGDAERMLIDDGDTPLLARPAPAPKETST
jgi:cbb3-type cytochrome oxidase maturation protein